jgi:hypothetical protein
LVQRTMTGQAFLRDLKKIVADADEGTGRAPSSASHAGVIVTAS